MAKAYFISCYRQITDPAKLAAYAKLATAAVEASGGRFIARGMPAIVYEAGQSERKLANPEFTAKAPAEVVAKVRQRLAAAQADIARLEHRLAAL